MREWSAVEREGVRGASEGDFENYNAHDTHHPHADTGRHDETRPGTIPCVLLAFLWSRSLFLEAISQLSRARQCP